MILTETDFARINRETTGTSRFSETDLLAYRAIEAAVLSKLAEQAGEPVGYEFQTEDGEWHSFIDQRHYENTVAGGFEKWVRQNYVATSKAGSAKPFKTPNGNPQSARLSNPTGRRRRASMERMPGAAINQWHLLFAK